MLAERFEKTIKNCGLSELKQPLFYNAPVGIRFKIGGKYDVYIKDDEPIPNPLYIQSAFERAHSIYKNLPKKPNLLRIDIYPNTENNDIILYICKYANLPQPYEIKKETLFDEDGQYARLQLYWDLSQINFNEEILIKEIIKSDIGGYSAFSSNVYLICEDISVLYYLYDDRGLDLLSKDKETIYTIYKHFNEWILEYDREKIDKVFGT